MSLEPTLIFRTDNREETIRKDTVQVGNVPDNQQETKFIRTFGGVTVGLGFRVLIQARTSVLVNLGN